MAEHKCEGTSAADGSGEMTLWNFADPAEAVDITASLYGSKASLAAASAAFTARYAGREADFRFWFTVFAELQRRGEQACASGEGDPPSRPEEVP
ncbi:hypothetical protein [Nitratireductor luteus]|uniref:hypothetical protein n=1 Tax=Nitratireductor luteus TaxID=2976980 RepID=UPI00223F2C25|nr:hypothetical protein [Nitratireductor luteus]